jgi:hypothetical protein
MSEAVVSDDTVIVITFSFSYIYKNQYSTLDISYLESPNTSPVSFSRYMDDGS